MQPLKPAILLPLILLGAAISPALSVPGLAPIGVHEGAAYSPTITVVQSTESTILLDLEMENLPNSSEVIDFQEPFPGLMDDMRPDWPVISYLIPRFTIYLALPRQGQASLTIEEWVTETYGADPVTVPENPTSLDTARLGNVGILGGVRMMPLTVRPIRYVNGQNTCEVMTSARLRIDVSGQGANELDQYRDSYSIPWQQIHQSVATNWEAIPDIHVGAPSHMLIICPDEYQSAIESFVDWKEQRGMHVTVVARSEIGTNPQSHQIRSRIAEEFENADPRIDYVLLVGDETKIAPHPETTEDPLSRFSDFSIGFGQYTNEGYYADLEGDDVFPDVFVGRWVANAESEVRTIAARSISHERDTYAVDNMRFSRAAVAADFTEYTQRLTKVHVRRELLSAGFTTVDTLWGDTSPGPQNLVNWINDGLAFVNYRGSGWSFGWAGISFYIPTIPGITNTGKLPIITGIGCGVGKFDEPDGDCFGEVFMSSGTVAAPEGAVGFIGPCWNTHTVYNDCLDSALYRAFLDYEVANLSPALCAGMMYTWAMFEDFLDEGAVLELCETMFRQYLVLSDPSLQIFTGQPPLLDVSAPQAIPTGPFNLDVTVNNLSFLNADSVLATVWFDRGSFTSRWIKREDATVMIPIEAQANQDVRLTVTGENVIAFHRQFQVNPEGPWVTHTGLVINDTLGGNGNGLLEPGETVDWLERVTNVGTETALSVEAHLSTDSDLILLFGDDIDLDDVAAGETVVGETPFSFTIEPVVPATRLIEFTVLFEAQNAPLSMSEVPLALYAPAMQMASLEVMDYDDGLLERRETANLLIEVRNAGNWRIAEGTCTLSSDDPFVTVLAGTAPLPGLGVGQSASLSAQNLRVQASAVTPSAYQAHLTLTVEAEMDHYTYSVDLPVVLTVGEVESTDPLLESSGRFWLYDNTDYLYEQAPEFEWIEISPQAGGPGTALPVTSAQATFPVTVPFTYEYYGQSFATLSISADGWVLPGYTEHIEFLNEPLPHLEDNVQGMLAPLWADLWYRFGDTGDLSYYYDAATDRFIVEWHEIHYFASNGFRETFQLHLLNPATYPTESGDAQWLIQYLDVSPLAVSQMGATVGIESLDGTEGATYLYRGQYAQAAAVLQDHRAILVTTEFPVILSSEPARVELPQSIRLEQNYPNPFNPDTRIEFALPNASVTTLEVFNLLGQRIATLVDGSLQAGNHVVTWNGFTDNGQPAVSGMYFYRLSTPTATLSRKMILLR